MTDNTDLDTVPQTGPSRLTRRPAPASNIDPDDIAQVDVRVAALREEHPKARIVTKAKHRLNVLGAPVYVVRASVWLDRTSDGRPHAVGHSERTYGVGDEPYSQHPLESAESIAIGRALRFLGYTERSQT